MLEMFKNYLLNFNIFPKNSRNITKFYSENHVFVFQIKKIKKTKTSISIQKNHIFGSQFFFLVLDPKYFF